MSNMVKTLWRYFWLTPVLGVLGAGVLWALGLVSFVVTFSLMSPQEPNQKTEGIVVLTGGPDRVGTGLKIFLDGQAPELLISGAYKHTTVDDMMRQANVHATDIPCCITLGHQATDTVGNARETAAWVAQHQIKSLRVITASYHMPRALLELRRALPGVTLVAHPVEARNFALLSRKGIILTFSEYHKSLVVAAKWVADRLRGHP